MSKEEIYKKIKWLKREWCICDEYKCKYCEHLEDLYDMIELDINTINGIRKHNDKLVDENINLKRELKQFKEKS